MAKIENSSIKFEIGVGFSKGCALFALKNPPPFVLQTGLEDFYVAYQINAYTREPSNQSRIYSDLHQHIQDCFHEAGIEILSPHYHAVRDGNMPTIPEGYLKGYKAPSFKVSEK